MYNIVHPDDHEMLMNQLHLVDDSDSDSGGGTTQGGKHAATISVTQRPLPSDNVSLDSRQLSVCRSNMGSHNTQKEMKTF